MKRIALLISACALGVSACGGEDDEPVQGSTVPPPVTTQPAPTDVAKQITELKRCLGDKETTRVDVFEPTYAYAKSVGGGGFAVTLRKQQVEFLVLPDAGTAQTASKDASNQLIALQQTKPEAYQAIAATATQVIDNVVEIVPTGPTPPKVNTKIIGCVQASRAASKQ
jgi:hypothetical protein